MTKYTYCTDSGSGAIEADSLEDALDAACKIAGVTQKTISDGAFCWVEDPLTHERRSAVPENEF